MGLDMYLYAEKYGSKFRGTGIEYPDDLKVLADDIDKRNFMSKTTRYQIGYWRKFNALHGYIIDKFNNGEDDGNDVYLSEKAIDELLDVCEQVLADLNTCPKVETNGVTMYASDVARLLLPVTDGFFFGSQEYDSWYKKDLEYTIDLLKKVKDIYDDYEIYYGASW